MSTKHKNTADMKHAFIHTIILASVITISGCGKSEDVEDLETQIYHLEDKIVELEDLAHKNIIRIEYLEDEVNDMSRDFKKLERKVDYIRYGN
jgi:predicted  nucleic acid-binding Zn-ribbon protein